jgi:hypothetical protein
MLDADKKIYTLSVIYLSAALSGALADSRKYFHYEGPFMLCEKN